MIRKQTNGDLVGVTRCVKRSVADVQRVGSDPMDGWLTEDKQLVVLVACLLQTGDARYLSLFSVNLFTDRFESKNSESTSFTSLALSVKDIMKWI